MKNRKEDIIFVAVLIALILVFVVFKVIKGKKVEAPSEEVAPVVTVAPEKEVPQIIVKKKKPVKIWPELSYTDAFMKYKDGNLMQFGQNCQARPVTMVLKSGTDLMLDNRQNKEEVIMIGNIKYTLPAYGYEIINISAKTLPATYQVDCTEARNVGTIVLE